jgi:hypothetical protein
MNTLADFKVGQKVVATDEHWRVQVRRKVGTVVIKDERDVGVAFEDAEYPVIYSSPHELVIAIEYIDKPNTKTLLPESAADRKKIPLASGVLDYFESALIEVAKVSQKGNDQHNPGLPLHWARGKSMDHSDTMLRHFMERGTLDTDGVRHSAKMVWRALAILQEEMEREGAPISRGSRVPEKK